MSVQTPSGALSPDDRRLFHELIVASRTLSRMCRIAGTTLSEEFESMIDAPMAAVDAVLEQCPVTVDAVWDGVFRDEDCDEERYTPDLQALPPEIKAGRVNSAVKLTHRLTGESVQVEQSADYDTNRQRAQRALRQRVQRLAAAQRTDPLH